MRLTKKDRYGHFYTNKANCRNIWSLDGKKLEGEFFENQTLATDGEAIDKLGQLEDVEEELGIDLITLFKALKNGVFIKLNDGRIIEGFSPTVQDFFDFICFTVCGKDIDSDYDFDEEVIHVEDYGRTWALTKEELC